MESGFQLNTRSSRSKFAPQNQLLFRELEFENQMDNQAWGITNDLIIVERHSTSVLIKLL
jgi:hypothetical protein